MELEGVASLALLSGGGLSGHFVDAATRRCIGLMATELACERECSRGEDAALLRLTLIDFQSGTEQAVVVEKQGGDAARLATAVHAHGWESTVIEDVSRCKAEGAVQVHFDCETLLTGQAADAHLRRFLPKLMDLSPVVNIGPMRVSNFHIEGAGVPSPTSSAPGQSPAQSQAQAQAGNGVMQEASSHLPRGTIEQALNQALDQEQVQMEHHAHPEAEGEVAPAGASKSEAIDDFDLQSEAAELQNRSVVVEEAAHRGKSVDDDIRHFLLQELEREGLPETLAWSSVEPTTWLGPLSVETSQVVD